MMDVVKPVLKYTSLSHGRPIICLAGGYGWTKLSNLQLRQMLVHGQALTSIHRNFSFPVNPILLSRRCVIITVVPNSSPIVSVGC